LKYGSLDKIWKKSFSESVKKPSVSSFDIEGCLVRWLCSSTPDDSIAFTLEQANWIAKITRATKPSFF
jgi:hypothetical protein